MIEKIYYYLHRKFSKPQERGEYSAGLWQDKIRAEALRLCALKEGRVLEVGCGEGLLLSRLAADNPKLELWGVDNSGPRVEQGQKRLAGKSVRLSVEDATSLSFTDKYFDKVICVNVLFNMADIEVAGKAFSQMKRVLKDEGRLIFDFRNADNPLLALKYKLAPLYDPTVKELPLKTYRLKSIRGLLGELGLEIVSLSYPGSSGGPWAPIIMVEAKKI